MSDHYSSWAEFAEQNPDRVDDQTAGADGTPSRSEPLSSKAENPTEAAIQKDVVRWARRHKQLYPALGLLHSTPNEGMADLHPATAKKRKKLGVRNGMPDLHLPVPSGDWPALWLEMKRPGSDLEPHQYRRLVELEEYGNATEVAWTAEQGIWVLRTYLDAPSDFLSGY